MAAAFTVGFTTDFFKPDGGSAFGNIGLDLLEQAGVSWAPVEAGPTLTPADLTDLDALALLGKRVTAETLAENDRLTIIARYGVGYDNVDLDACTRHGVLVTITPDGVRRPMALVNLTYLLALGHRLLEQDRLTRSGGWARKIDYRGLGFSGRTVGTIGFGNIAREFHQIARPIGLRHLAYDPYARPADAVAAGVELVDLETLLRESDFVVVACALTPETHHLLNAERLAQMKPTAYLISTARGPIVDQRALTEALRERRLAGAGLDVFEREPVDPADPILKLDNVIVSPHALCLTDEWSYLTGRSALGGVLDVAAGRVPPNVVNREVLESPLLAAKLARYRGEGA